MVRDGLLRNPPHHEGLKEALVAMVLKESRASFAASCPALSRASTSDTAEQSWIAGS
jgi:hypothetical protein